MFNDSSQVSIFESSRRRIPRLQLERVPLRIGHVTHRHPPPVRSSQRHHLTDPRTTRRQHHPLRLEHIWHFEGDMPKPMPMNGFARLEIRCQLENLECGRVLTPPWQSQVNTTLMHPLETRQGIQLRASVIAFGWHGHASENVLVKRSQGAPVSSDQVRVDVPCLQGHGWSLTVRVATLRVVRRSKAICFDLGRVCLTEHRTNAYFSGTLLSYDTPDLGLRQWVRSAMTALCIKADPFKSLEWQKTFLSNLHSSDETTLADVLRKSLNDLELHAAGPVDEIAREMIEHFVSALALKEPSHSLIRKLDLHLGLQLSPKRIHGFPDLFEQLSNHPKALVAVGPPDLIQRCLEHFELAHSFERVHISSRAGPEYAPYDVDRVLEGWDIVGENLFLASTGQWYKVPAKPRKG
jgi:hypothetical protein